MTKNLEWMIDPFPKDRFVQNYLEEKPLFIPRQCRGYFDTLLTATQIDDLLENAQFPTSYGVRLTSAQSPPAPSEYLTIRKSGNLHCRTGIGHERVLNLFHQSGATIILDNIGRATASVKELSGSLSKEFNCQIGVDIHVTPGSAQSLAAMDTHDVFILQIKGRKTWHVCENPIYLPLGPQKSRNISTDKLEQICEAELQEGDTLYIPRGFIHKTDASAGPSAHLAVGVYFTTYLRLILDFIKRAGQNDFVFRKDFFADTLRSTDPAPEAIQHIRDYFQANFTAEALEKEFAKYKPDDRTLQSILD
jgi:lysine-specific demethylase/histidyl-hydroxylase NO66